MKVLVACEYSGRVREAFAAKGHDAWSCDILPTDIAGQHYQGDVMDIIDEGWDLMIAHPPCTYLCVSGLHWCKKDPTRIQKGVDALEFFKKLHGANIKYKAIENPVGIVSTKYMKPTQYIQPYEFGHPESKKTGLWLVNLPKLTPTNNVKHIFDTLPLREKHRIWYMGSNRGKERSMTYQGIANAMAEQWG